MPACLPACLPVCLPACPSVYLQENTKEHKKYIFAKEIFFSNSNIRMIQIFRQRVVIKNAKEINLKAMSKT